MPKNDEAHVLVRMSYQSPIDAHFETLEISVPPNASDELIEESFATYGKIRKIMAKTIVDLLTADDNPRIDQPVPQSAPAPNRTLQPNGGNGTSKPKVLYTAERPFETVIFFGKHSGKSLAQIESLDNSYIDWLYDNTREPQLQSDCNVIITMRGSDEYEAILHPVVQPADEDPEDDEPFDDLVDADLFPAN